MLRYESLRRSKRKIVTLGTFLLCQMSSATMPASIVKLCKVTVHSIGFCAFSRSLRRYRNDEGDWLLRRGGEVKNLPGLQFMSVFRTRKMNKSSCFEKYIGLKQYLMTCSSMRRSLSKAAARASSNLERMRSKKYGTRLHMHFGVKMK